MPNTSSKYLLEIACFNVESCLIAQEAGADRIEFCADYNVGGITPTHYAILEARDLVQIPLHVIIRPRGGNFVYSLDEIKTMKDSILFCKEHNINSVVLGVLNSDNTIDFKITKELVQLAKPMSVIFHRAIDECADIERGFNELIGLGINKVLTSGGKQNAIDGIKTLKKYQAQFGEKIIIMPGGGIRSANIESILTETQCIEYHSSALTSGSENINLLEIKEMKEKLLQL